MRFLSRRTDYEESLVFITNTVMPYVAHLPAILSAPWGANYIFRYQDLWVSSRVDEKESDLDGMYGLLYLRNKGVGNEMCAPIRRFQVVSHEKSGPLLFIVCKMLDIVKYKVINIRMEQDGGYHIQNNDGNPSIDMLHKEIEHRKAEGISIPNVWGISIPETSEPQLKWYSEIKRSEESGTDKFVYIRNTKKEKRPNRREQASRWYNQLGIFPWMGMAGEFYFWHVRNIGRIKTRRKNFKGLKNNVKSAWHLTNGIKVTPRKQYNVGVLQADPTLFEKKEDRTDRKYKLDLASSDCGIEPISRAQKVDGLYGFYELSFRLQEIPWRTKPVLRITLDEDSPGNSPVNYPPLEIPITGKSRVWKFIGLLMLTMIALAGYVFADRLAGKIYGDQVDQTVVSLAKLFLLTIGIVVGGRFRSLSVVKTMTSV